MGFPNRCGRLCALNGLRKLRQRTPGLEAPVALLEAGVSEIRGELKAVPIELAETKGRMSNLPTTIQLVFMLATL
jgi:hypothetical protein